MVSIPPLFLFLSPPPPDPTKLTHDDPLEKERRRRVLEHANKAFPDGFSDPFSIDKTRFVSGSRR